MRQPARHAGDGEQHGEHLHREAHRLVDQTRVEVDVRVQLAVDEVGVRQGGLLERQRDVEQRVLAGDLEHVVGGLLDDRGPRVVVLVHPVAEAHQAALARLDRLDERGDVVDRADLGRASARRPRWRRRAAGRRALPRLPLPTSTGRPGWSRSTRIAVVPQFCSWSAWRMNSTSIARSSTRVDLVVADLPHHVEEVGRDTTGRCSGRLNGQADREAVAHGGERRASWRSAAGSALSRRRGRRCPWRRRRTCRARRRAEVNMPIGWAS